MTWLLSPCLCNFLHCLPLKVFVKKMGAFTCIWLLVLLKTAKCVNIFMSQPFIRHFKLLEELTLFKHNFWQTNYWEIKIFSLAKQRISRMDISRTIKMQKWEKLENDVRLTSSVFVANCTNALCKGKGWPLKIIISEIYIFAVTRVPFVRSKHAQFGGNKKVTCHCRFFSRSGWNLCA